MHVCCLLCSCYKLLISENHSVVKTSSCYEMDTKLLSLLHLPVKDPQDYYSLGDITANGQSLDGRILNVLAAVMSVSQGAIRLVLFFLAGVTALPSCEY